MVGVSTASTREVKLCCCFTQATTDEKGRPVRDPRSSSYLITFDPAADFGVLMAAEARRRGAGRIRQLVLPGDGAAWIWNLAARHFPEATQIADLFNAREHLDDLARLLESCSAMSTSAQPFHTANAAISARPISRTTAGSQTGSPAEEVAISPAISGSPSAAGGQIR